MNLRDRSPENLRSLYRNCVKILVSHAKQMEFGDPITCANPKLSQEMCDFILTAVETDLVAVRRVLAECKRRREEGLL